MQTEVILCIVSGICSLAGTFGGIMASNRLTTYRIQELEKKVDKHNKVIERVGALEIYRDEDVKRLDRIEECIIK